MEKEIRTPLIERGIKKLKAGERVFITGKIYTARDLAHKRFMETISQKRKLPVNLKDQIIYYCGPTPAKPGNIIGSAGPTTSSRMDEMTGPLLALGLKGAIGKGQRDEKVLKMFKKHRAIYFVATGGAGALLAQNIKAARVVAYPDLGPEAVYELEVYKFPVFVANDIYGNNIFKRRRIREK